jgi:hypothetical protein
MQLGHVPGGRVLWSQEEFAFAKRLGFAVK